MGGFARRMSYWNAFSRKFPGAGSLRLDGGSLFNAGVAEGPIVNRWMLEGSARSGLDAVNLTVWDVPVWQEMADLAAAGQIPKELLELPLVSANVRPKIPNFPRIQPYIIKEYGSGPNRLRVAVTGLLFDREERLSRREFGVEDPQAAARRFVEEVKEKSDYRVAMTDMDLGRSISFAIGVQGIDLLVVAHNYVAATDPQMIGDTLVVTPYNEGRTIGEVRLALKPGAKPEFETRVVALDYSVPDDVPLGELVRRAQAELDAFKKK